MMTFCRYASAVVILIVASLTPTSCSDVAEPAIAAEEAEIKFVGDPADLSGLSIESLESAPMGETDSSPFGS